MDKFLLFRPDLKQVLIRVEILKYSGNIHPLVLEINGLSPISIPTTLLDTIVKGLRKIYI